MKYYFILVLVCSLFFSCRFNKVSVKVRNKTGQDLKVLIVRIGDTLQVFKDMKNGETSRRFWSNETRGKEFAKMITGNDDTLSAYPNLLLRGKKSFYKGKILVKIKIDKTEDQRDTVIMKVRRRFIF